MHCVLGEGICVRAFMLHMFMHACMPVYVLSHPSGSHGVVYHCMAVPYILLSLLMNQWVICPQESFSDEPLHGTVEILLVMISHDWSLKLQSHHFKVSFKTLLVTTRGCSTHSSCHCGEVT